MQKREDSCVLAGHRHLLDLISWARSRLSASARRRIILAHIGFLQDHPQTLQTVMSSGISSDLAIGLRAFARGGMACALRDFVASYPQQVMWGTDIKIDRPCGARDIPAWKHLLAGRYGEKKTFSTCFGELTLEGAALGQHQAAGCQAMLPAGALDAVRRGNFLQLFEE